MDAHLARNAVELDPRACSFEVQSPLVVRGRFLHDTSAARTASMNANTSTSSMIVRGASAGSSRTTDEAQLPTKERASVHHLSRCRAHSLAPCGSSFDQASATRRESRAQAPILVRPILPREPRRADKDPPSNCRGSPRSMVTPGTAPTLDSTTTLSARAPVCHVRA
jgi:hypothetical protein